MTTYEIIYDICYEIDGIWIEDSNIVEEFNGTYHEMREYLKEMKQNGCYNISCESRYEIEGDY